MWNLENLQHLTIEVIIANRSSRFKIMFKTGSGLKICFRKLST